MIKGVLLDLSGVLYEGDCALPGAVDALKRLSRQLPVAYVTNTSRKPRSTVHAMLQSMGFDIAVQDVFTAATAAHQYIQSHRLRPHLLIHPALDEEFSDLDSRHPNAVVLGDAAEYFTYNKLNQAFRVLMQEESIPLIAMGYNRYFKESDGLSLDLGAFASCLEFASGKQAIITGKPARDFYLQAVAHLGCTPEQVLMVGDDVYSDVEGAMHAGLQACLVKTGKYREGDEIKIDHQPDRLCNNFSDLVEDLFGH
ncbi:MAG: TIGR01458 family HAD-type hydrolase [Gammaproteobacteria bacterium]